jgi:predicted nucleotidyltransferase
MEKIFNEEKHKQLQNIKAEILRCLEGMQVSMKSIILFGSRAIGDFSKYSDYDFLIITEKTYSIKEKMEIAKAIRKALAELYIPTDIIINSEEEVEYKKNKIGYVTRYALKEGVSI